MKGRDCIKNYSCKIKDAYPKVYKLPKLTTD